MGPIRTTSNAARGAGGGTGLVGQELDRLSRSEAEVSRNGTVLSRNGTDCVLALDSCPKARHLLPNYNSLCQARKRAFPHTVSNSTYRYQMALRTLGIDLAYSKAARRGTEASEPSAVPLREVDE